MHWRVEICTAHIWSGRVHLFCFADQERAEAEYTRLAGMIKKCKARENDAPLEVEITDDFGRGTYGMADMTSVRLLNWEEWTRADHRAGRRARKEFPDLYVDATVAPDALPPQTDVKEPTDAS